MVLLSAIIYFLMLIAPGLISEWLYNLISGVRQRAIIATTLIFDLLIFIINMTGLRIFNNVYRLEDLLEHFLCLNFTRNYGILSIIVAIVLGVLLGILSRIFFIRYRSTGNKN